ncbi:malonate decarboxylase holo-ACP synthase [Pseudomonas sp. F1_0610]|uniref:malonate decarboxylase holo-ACP synthase n=1 Tax=Pseudomonas sp. F1_0610 TaxID=3114284 RepID=UPI0039C2AFB1
MSNCAAVYASGLLPHDLVWGLTANMLADDAPAWVAARLADNHPVVVRRDQQHSDRVAVGVRGKQKIERYATWLAVADITKVTTPDQLLHKALTSDLAPVISRLQLLLKQWQWGITGSHAYQLATQEHCITTHSDLDLTVRLPFALGRAHAKRLWIELQEVSKCLDVQLETPLGAVSLAEWASDATKVMLKTHHGPVLTQNPWQKEGL